MCRFGQNRDFRTFPQLINQCFDVVLHVYFIILMCILIRGAVACSSGCNVGVRRDYGRSVGTKPDTRPDIALQRCPQKPLSVARHRRWWAMLCHPKIWPPSDYVYAPTALTREPCGSVNSRMIAWFDDVVLVNPNFGCLVSKYVT